jgi:hypothetical protein
MEQIPVGKYRLGLRWVHLFADPSTASGSVELLPDDKGQTKVIVGIAGDWEEAVSTFLHEAYEAVFVDLNVRYKNSPSFCSESSDYVFHMTHNEMSEAHDRIGGYVKDALPSFMTAYRAWHKKKKALDKKNKKK